MDQISSLTDGISSKQFRPELQVSRIRLLVFSRKRSKVWFSPSVSKKDAGGGIIPFELRKYGRRNISAE
jgi:hypothetical protein